MSDSIAFGLHAVRTLLERHPQRVSGVLLQRGREDQRTAEITRLARERQIKIETKSVQELDQLAGGGRHQGVIAQIIPSSTQGEGALDDILDAAGTNPLVLVLDGVQDPHNLGACMRTADAMGVCAVVVPRERAAGLSSTVRKVAAGAAETVPLVQVVNLARTLKWLKERGLWTVGTDGDADKSLHDVDLKGPLAIVMGAEGAGLRRLTRENCDLLVKIPMHGAVESLNVSVATGVVLYEAVRQRGARTVDS
jgi:23S rRNA (guanosine2251-2'-O)-methyltransferase